MSSPTRRPSGDTSSRCRTACPSDCRSRSRFVRSRSPSPRRRSSASRRRRRSRSTRTSWIRRWRSESEPRPPIVFEREADYYGDLQTSRFGITTKRAGWDCLRHYEIAANGCVPCFRHLDRKPPRCAPHGLEPGVNCLSYRDADDLMRQVDALATSEYDAAATGALAWARANSTRRALRVPRGAGFPGTRVACTRQVSAVQPRRCPSTSWS